MSTIKRMESNQKITTMIHDLNPWGGQDRSMLEIAWELNKEFPLEIHSFTLQGKEDWPDMHHIAYQANITRPIIFKYLSYQSQTYQRLKIQDPKVVQSTGTASVVSDVVQVQFIHHTWQDIAKKLPEDKRHNPTGLRALYQKALNIYKKAMEKKVYQPEKKYIAISHGIKKELMKHFGIPQQNIEIIYHGVDHKHFHPADDKKESREKRQEVRQNLGINEDDFVLLHVGALNARKGLFQSFKMMSYLKKNGFDKIKLLAVGQGDAEILQQLSKDEDVEDRIILAPHSKDIRNYYWAADCFFFPTFYEPFGLVILEAMACGLPAVISQYAGGAELIESEESGILFNPYDSPEKMANSLLPLLRDPHYRKYLGKSARKVALQHGWDKVGEQYRNFYRRYFAEKTQ